MNVHIKARTAKGAARPSKGSPRPFSAAAAASAGDAWRSSSSHGHASTNDVASVHGTAATAAGQPPSASSAATTAAAAAAATMAYGDRQPIAQSGGFIKVTANALKAVNESTRTRKYSGIILEANGKVSQPIKATATDGSPAAPGTPSTVAASTPGSSAGAAVRASVLHGALLAAATEFSVSRDAEPSRPSLVGAAAAPLLRPSLVGAAAAPLLMPPLPTMSAHAAVLTAFLGGAGAAAAPYNRYRLPNVRIGYRPTYRHSYKHVVGLLKSEDERANLKLRSMHPDYGSLVTQIHEVNKEADSDIEFLYKSYRILHNTAVMSVVLFVLLAIPISMIAFGINELLGCPKEPLIPVYLLVGGCVGLLKLLSVIWRQLRTRYFFETPDAMSGMPPEREDTLSERRSTLCTDIIISVFLLVWFVLGNYWTWRHWKPKFVMTLHEPTDWCDRTLYLFTVGQIVTCYIIVAAVLLLAASLCCCRQVCCYHDRIPKRVLV